MFSSIVSKQGSRGGQKMVGITTYLLYNWRYSCNRGPIPERHPRSELSMPRQGFTGSDNSPPKPAATPAPVTAPATAPATETGPLAALQTKIEAITAALAAATDLVEVEALSERSAAASFSVG